MKLYGIITGKATLDRVTNSMCQLSKAPSEKFQSVLKNEFKNIKRDHVPIFGHFLGPRRKIFIRLYRGPKDHRRDFFLTDHAYFWRGHTTAIQKKPQHKHIWYRISKNGHMQTTLKDVTGERWEKIFKPHFPVKKYHRKGNHILVCPLGQTVGNLYGQDAKEWLKKTLAILKANTDREIVVRHKPIMKGGKFKPKRALDEDLKNCYAVVTHSSTVAVEAQLQGIPTFCDKSCCALPVSHSDFSLIENPLYDIDVRQEWLHTLAWSQFSLPEITDGTALKHLRKMPREYRYETG